MLTIEKVKQQYVGDVNDYRKYGLLRVLSNAIELDTLVAWMLTPDDSRSDGRFISYLDQPHRWRSFDPELFDTLRHIVVSGDRSVGRVQESRLLPRARYFAETVPDRALPRAMWARALVEAAHGAELVFLDPDNGLEIPSKTIGRKGSSKYASWAEVEALWAAGASLLIYQHLPREPRRAFISRTVSELRRRTGADLIEAFTTAQVTFLLAGQKDHASVLRVAVDQIRGTWLGQLHVGGFSAG